jgi:hypothetical protein
MKTLMQKGFLNHLNQSRTEPYPVLDRKLNRKAKTAAPIAIQEKVFRQAKHLQPRPSVNDAHQVILTNYSLERRFFW